jgi:hypothetical protein
MPETNSGTAAQYPRQPLGVEWVGHEVDVLRAGSDSVSRLVVANAGSATWRRRDGGGVRVSYHWLDLLGNAVVWDSPRTDIPHNIAPGERMEISVPIRAPIPPGDYVLAFDLVEEFQFWFSDVGVPMLKLPCTVRSGIDERRLAVVVHPGPGDAAETYEALRLQDESLVDDDPTAVAHLVAGCLPPPDWSSRLLDAHAEGFAAVGAAVVPAASRRSARQWSWLQPWQPRPVRDPRFSGRLILPSLVRGLEPSDERGWPSYAVDPALPRDRVATTVFDGRIVVRFQPRSGRRPT